MSHKHLIIQTLILFFGFAVSAKTVCVLTEKNVDLRKYSFKCNDQTVNVQCKSKDEDEDICGVTIKSAIETMKFSISEDELDSFNLFSKSDLTKIECDSSKKLCKLDNNVCKKYEKYYESLKEDFIGDFNSPGRCAGAFLGASIQNVGALSWGMVSETDFRKNDCT